MGSAISGMHYLGMMAIIAPVIIKWDEQCVLLSIVFGIAPSAASLALTQRRNDALSYAFATALLALAICTMHFTGMTAIHFRINPYAIAPEGIGDEGDIAIAAAAITFLVIALGFFSSILDSHLAARRRLEKHRLSQTIASLPQGVCVFDKRQSIIVKNDRFHQLHELSADAVKPGCTLREILEMIKCSGAVPADSQIDDLVQHLTLQLDVEKPIDTIVEMRSGRVLRQIVQPTRDDGWVMTTADITAHRQKEAHIRRLAHYDTLTGLANRNLFIDRITEFAARQKRLGIQFAVLLLDLDHFKAINDKFGHDAGDGLLSEVGSRLRGCLRIDDVAARLGGDEFAIIASFDSKSGRKGIEVLATQAIRLLSQPFVVNGQPLGVGCSIGIAFGPDHGVECDELLKNADLALYKSKQSGRNCYTIFDPTLKELADRRSQLEVDLRRAIWLNEFELFYQPVIDTRSAQVKVVEALLRWKHPKRGYVQPDEFIPLAEETGIIIHLGQWILVKACHDAMAMPKHVRVAVNVSPVQFSMNNLRDSVIFALVDSGLSPDRLELEITEGVLLRENEQTRSMLFELQALGVGIVLDDFGVGYSSLSYLTSFPFNKVKIDKSFIRTLEKRKTLAVIDSIVRLSRTLTLTICAEGIETNEQLEKVRGMGIELAQGYLFSKPVQSDQLMFVFPSLAPADGRAA